MKKKLIDFIREKLPLLFVFCIKRGWIYPEPIVYSNSVTVSIEMKMSYRDMKREVFELLMHQITGTAFEAYKKINYFPYPDTIEIQRYEDFANYKTVFRWKMTAFYCPILNYRRVDDFISKLKELYLK